MTVFLQMCYYFLWFAMYSMAGWCYEVVLFRFTAGKWINRGFLYGPFLPIFGVGADMFWAALGWIPGLIRGWIPILWVSIIVECAVLFIIGGVLACALEYATAAVLENVFHTRWWDYDKNWGNIKGRIAPIGFVAFGGFAAALVEFIQPAVLFVTQSIPDVIIMILAIGVGALMMADFLATLWKLIRSKKNHEHIHSPNDDSHRDPT